jgi:hypothetical protein
MDEVLAFEDCEDDARSVARRKVAALVDEGETARVVDLQLLELRQKTGSATSG